MGTSTTSRVLVIIAAVIGVALVVYAIVSFRGTSSTTTTSGTTVTTGERPSITIATSTTLYVDPRTVQNRGDVGGGSSGGNGQTSGSTGSGVTPPAPASTRTTGGLFGSFFGRLTGRPDLPSGYTQSDLSQLYRAVRVNNVQAARAGGGGLFGGSGTVDTVTLRENIGSNDAPISITGWTLKSNRGSYKIGQGVRLYRTTSVPLESIVLRDGERALVVSGTSAVTTNFMVNSCMGYLSTRYTFAPQLPRSCPSVPKSDIETFTGACQDYILKLRTCAEGDVNDARIPANDTACRRYVGELTYEGCIKRRQNESGFLSGEWRVWSGDRFIDPLHDRVLLLDQNGKLVDWYVY